MKKKIVDLTYKEIYNICDKIIDGDCTKCPFKEEDSYCLFDYLEKIKYHKEQIKELKKNIINIYGLDEIEINENNIKRNSYLEKFLKENKELM